MVTYHSREYLDILNQISDLFRPMKNTGSTHTPDKTHQNVWTTSILPPSMPTATQLQFAKKEFDQMLSDDIIRLSDSPYASPLHLVLKPGSTDFRICVDNRRLNASTIPDPYSVPHIHDFASGLQGAIIFVTTKALPWRANLYRHFTQLISRWGTLPSAHPSRIICKQQTRQTQG